MDETVGPCRRGVEAKRSNIPVHVWGPGRGKTTGQVIRHAYYAPGAYMLTMNKLDGVAEVIAARRASEPEGTIWVFDQQQIFGQTDRPAFTVDLLASVHNTESATDLATIFEDATKDENSRNDPQFDTQGRDFLAWCLLAASVSGNSLHAVYRWITQADFRTPASVLHNTGHSGAAAALLGMNEQPEKTRGSVAATAQRMASPMVHDRLMSWVTPKPNIPTFSPDAFVTSTDTLIMLSEERSGSVGAFVSALVESVFHAAQKAAQANGGRLSKPLIADLDECGNVVKLRKLPDWYTYFGSLGIIVSAYFQSKAQADTMFGTARWKQLWDAAGIRVFGGGIDDDAWLASLSKLFGTYEETQTTRTTNPEGQVTRSTSTREKELVSISDLADLPEWRALIRTSNGVSTMVEIVPAFKDRKLTFLLPPLGPAQAQRQESTVL